MCSQVGEGTEANCEEVLHRTVLRSVLGLSLFYIFLNNLDDRVESTFVTFTGNTKLVGIASTLEDRLGIQNALERMEKWCEIRCNSIWAHDKMLHAGRNNQRQDEA